MWTAEHGILVTGRGLGDRREAAFEIDSNARGRGYGRPWPPRPSFLPDGHPI